MPELGRWGKIASRRSIDQNGGFGRRSLQRALYTIGYQGAQIGDLIDALKGAEVRCLVDVRDAPISRKPDFAKTRLAAHLEDAGIGYRHEKALGNPKSGREAARSGDAETYLTIFSRHMAAPPARRAVKEIARLAADQPICLLCLERDPGHCHRSIVADHLAAVTGQTVEHLFAGSSPGQGNLFEDR